MQMPGLTAAQSVSAVHAIQTFVERLQIGVLPTQFAFDRQPTHVPTLGLVEVPADVTQAGVAELRTLQASEPSLLQPVHVKVLVSQMGVASLQSLFDRQPTHLPVIRPASRAQKAVPASRPPQAFWIEVSLHPRQAPASLSQIGVALGHGGFAERRLSADAPRAAHRAAAPPARPPAPPAPAPPAASPPCRPSQRHRFSSAGRNASCPRRVQSLVLVAATVEELRAAQRRGDQDKTGPRAARSQPTSQRQTERLESEGDARVVLAAANQVDDAAGERCGGDAGGDEAWDERGPLAGLLQDRSPVSWRRIGAGRH